MLRAYEEELTGVRDQLETALGEKTTLQKELSNLEGKYKVLETLTESQETELQALKVPTLLLICAELTGSIN